MAEISHKRTSVSEFHTQNGGSLGLESSVLDALDHSILFFDRSGKIVSHNIVASTRFNVGSLAGQTFKQVATSWDDPDAREREILEVIVTGEAQTRSLERAVQGGREYWFEVDKIPLRDKQQQVSGVALIINDVSQRVHRELVMQESEARYKAFIANSIDAIWRYDICPPIDVTLSVKQQVRLLRKRAVLAECNDKLAQLFDAERVEDVIGLPLHLSDSLEIKRDLIRFVKNGYRVENGESSRRSKSGQVVYIQNYAIGIVENGYLIRAWGTSRDITLQKSYVQHMEFMATHDELTRLPNRTYLYREMESLLKARPGQPMALLLIDLDKFKEINDTLGHVAGDQVLKELGPRLQSELEETRGIISRLGGDEFAIFLPQIRNSQHAVVMAHRVLDAISEPFYLDGFYTELSGSIGISLSSDQANDVSTLMRYADVAMYQAKHNLKGVMVYDSEFDPHSPLKLEISGALGRAIREEELRLVYQPKISLATRRVCGMEALVRWVHPELGIVSPSDFIPIAESSNLIYPLTNWVIETAIKQAAIWRDQGYELSVATNLSARNLADDRIVNDIKDLLKRYQLEASRLEFEITESMIMADPSRSKVTLDALSELGVKLSIDDYGTGYSSLAYLKKLPVDALKIDMSFIQSMLEDEQDAIIVHSTIQLAHNLGLSVVAEGVETAEVRVKLAEMGCDDAQGYEIARPMQASEIEEWFSESRYRVITP